MLDFLRRKSNGSTTALLEAEPVVTLPTIPAKGLPQPTIGQEELARYTELAAKVKFAPPALLQHRLVQFLLDNNIEVYPLESVEKYLDHKFGLPKKRPDFFDTYAATWGWHPLRAEDNCKLTNHRGSGENGAIQRDTYRKIVPAPVLETVDLIATHFEGSEPKLHFFVGDAVVPSSERDPFLCVSAMGLESVVIERWDEPAFRR